MASYGMIFGNARVSTNDQSLNAQHDDLAEVSAERVFSETVGGAKDKHPELGKMRVGVYRLHDLIERYFNRIKNARRFAIRHDKTVDSFIYIASIRLWLCLLST